MQTNSWDNFDPSYPYGVSFEDIWVEDWFKGMDLKKELSRWMWE